MPRKTIKDYELETRNRIELIDHLHREVSRLGKEVDEAKKSSKEWWGRYDEAKREITWFKHLVQMLAERNPNALPR